MKHFIPVGFLLVSSTILSVAQDSPESVLPGTKQFRKTVVATALENPWEITWGPDNMLWVTERTGKRISRLNPTTGEKKVAITIPEVVAPGGQDGLLGMALHPDLLKGKGTDYVYVFHTYVDEARGARPTVTDPKSPYRFFYGKIIRLTYDKATQTLSGPQEVLAGLPVGNDHLAGRLKFGPDRKLYLTLGDQGNNQLGNFCRPVEAQRLPTRAELDAKNYISYVGKSLRINLDGGIPADNAKLNGVLSHVFTYGHRNPQGIDFGPDGTLYSSEQGPKSDDEVNILKSGGNYGWPHVAGMKDNKGYEFARWAEATTPCSELRFSDITIHPSVPREPESAFTKPLVEPIATMFTVETGFNFQSPVCKGVDFICWPTTGNSNVEYYSNRAWQGKGNGIPGWDQVALVTTLKRGSLYVLPLTANGQKAAGKFSRYFQSDNRYRDTAISPDGKTIYIATDAGGMSEAVAGGATRKMVEPGSILAFTYTGEGTAAPVTQTTKPAAPATPQAVAAPTTPAGDAPQFTAAQALAGVKTYNAECAVCHGSTLTNGTFAPPLAGEYFKTTWAGKPLNQFFETAKQMPPGSPGALSDATVAEIVAYILETNAYKAGPAPLPTNRDAMRKMIIR